MARDDEDTTTTPDTRGKYWSEIEQLQFKNGVIAKGWSSWASMAGSIIPTRDASQIGSYAQKLLRNYPEEVDWLIQEHHKKMTMEVMAAAAVAVAKGGGSKPKRAKKPSSSPPPRRRASTSKAKTLALARSNSPRQTGSSSAPGRKKNIMIPSSPPAAAAPSLSSPPSTTNSIPLGVISDVYRTTLGSDAPSTSAQLSKIMSPTTIPHRSSHLSVGNEDIASNDDYLNKDDELAVLASTVTFSSDPLFTLFDELLYDALELPLFASRNDEISDTSNADTSDSFLFTDKNDATLDGNDDAVIDPLLCMKFEERDLGMVFDFVGTSSRNAIVLATNNEQNDLAMTHYIDIARPSPHISKHIRSMLIAPTDYNNPTEYFLAADGASRTGLHRGAVCRARIKKLLGDCAWCEDDVNVVSLTQSALDTYYTHASLGSFEEVGSEGEEGVFKTIAFEIFVALAAAMLDENDWCTPMNGDPSASAKDVQDIRYVGNLLHSQWERVDPPRRRDCALQHDDDTLAAAAERNAAISSIVDRLKLVSRLENIHAIE